MEFSYRNPTLIEFGKGKIARIKELVPQEKKVLMVYGGGSIKQNGVYDQVKDALSTHTWFEFGGIEPNPTKETLDKAIAYGREKGADYILAVGGGSVLDGCKYIVNAYYYEGDGWDLLEGTYTASKAPELGAVLTLAATGSESNTGAVITRAATKEKRFFHSPLSYPQFSVLDPEVLKSLDDRQLANGIIDSFVHTCEQYLTYQHGGMAQDHYSEGIMRGLVQLADTFDTRDDLWYANLMWLANQALNGLIGLGVPQDWATHFIGHELSGLYGIDHAKTLAIVQPNLLMLLINEKRDKLLQMGKSVFNIDTQDPETIVIKLEKLYSSLGVDLNLSSYTDDKEVKPKVLSLLEKHGFVNFGDRGLVSKEIVEEILEMAQ